MSLALCRLSFEISAVYRYSFASNSILLISKNKYTIQSNSSEVSVAQMLNQLQIIKCIPVWIIIGIMVIINGWRQTGAIFILSLYQSLKALKLLNSGFLTLSLHHQYQRDLDTWILFVVLQKYITVISSIRLQGDLPSYDTKGSHHNVLLTDGE